MASVCLRTSRVGMITDELHAWSIAFKLLLVHLLAPKSNSAEDWNFWKKQLVLRNGLCCKWPRHTKQCPNGWCLTLIMASVCNFRRKLWQSRIAAVCNKLYIKYCKISNNWYTPFSKNKKKANFGTPIYSYMQKWNHYSTVCTAKTQA